MTAAEVGEPSGMDRQAATLAAKREYQETLVPVHHPDQRETLTDTFSQHSFGSEMLRMRKGAGQ